MQCSATSPRNLGECGDPIFSACLFLPAVVFSVTPGAKWLGTMLQLGTMLSSENSAWVLMPRNARADTSYF